MRSACSSARWWCSAEQHRRAQRTFLVLLREFFTSVLPRFPRARPEVQKRSQTALPQGPVCPETMCRVRRFFSGHRGPTNSFKVSAQTFGHLVCSPAMSPSMATGVLTKVTTKCWLQTAAILPRTLVAFPVMICGRLLSFQHRTSQLMPH